MGILGYTLCYFLFGIITINIYALPRVPKEVGDIEPYGSVADLINSTIENLRPSISDPLDIPDLTIPLSFSDSLLNGTIEISDPSVIGLQSFLLPYIQASLDVFKGVVSLDIIVVFSTLQLKTNYKANTIVLDIMPIYGDDVLDIKLNNLQITISAAAQLSPIALQDLRVEIELENINVNIHGLLNDEDFSAFASSLITKVGNEVIVKYINQNAQSISDTISPIIGKWINDTLASDNGLDYITEAFESINSEIQSTKLS